MAKNRRRDAGATKRPATVATKYTLHPANEAVVTKWRLGDLLEQLLEETPQSLAIAVLHVHEFDASSIRCNIADDCGGLDLAKASSNFQLHGVAGSQAQIGFQ